MHFSRPAVLLEYKYIIYIIKYYEYYKYYDAYIYAYNVHHNNNSVISVYFPIQNQCGCITLTASVFRLFSPLWRRLAIDGFEAPRTWSWPLRPCLRPLHRSWWTPIHIIIASSLLTNKRDAVPTPVDVCVLNILVCYYRRGEEDRRRSRNPYNMWCDYVYLVYNIYNLPLTVGLTGYNNAIYRGNVYIQQTERNNRRSAEEEVLVVVSSLLLTGDYSPAAACNVFSQEESLNETIMHGPMIHTPWSVSSST